ncbi:hypothetical protein ABVT39_019537 [Epinephelus coioides]
MPAVVDEDKILLKKANKKISDLKDDIRRLSHELRKKDSLLSSYMDVAASQSIKLASLSVALQDTVAWDPSICPQPPSCSTPNHESPWTEVAVGGRKRDSKGAPRLSLSNRYAALSADNNPVHPTDVLPAAAAPPRQDLDQKPPTAYTADFPPLLADSAQVTGSSATELQRPASRSASSSARRRILRDAVLQRSGGLPRPEPKEKGNPSPGSPRSASAPPPPHQPAEAHSVDRASSNHETPQFSSPRPLFSPTTLIVGDSITRNIRYFNAATHCFPGATVPVILEKLPGLLRSLPSSITRVLIHVGCNDTSRQQSELTKKDFNALFRFLNDTGKSVFISGPLPVHTLGAGRFSRLLYLNTWLQSTCKALNFGFIDNFNLFWNRPSFYKPDGVHPNRLGSQMLTANIRHAVQYAPRD